MNDSRLPLDHPGWTTLGHRGGTGPVPDLDVAAELRALVAAPDDEERFDDLWPWLCSENTTWPSAYAAAPYLVDLAAAGPVEWRANRVTVVGLIALYGDPAECPAELLGAYEGALARALDLAATALPRVTGGDLRWLLGAVAALRGEDALAEVLVEMDSLSEECPSCGEEVYPELLQTASGT